MVKKEDVTVQDEFSNCPVLDNELMDLFRGRCTKNDEVGAVAISEVAVVASSATSCVVQKVYSSDETYKVQVAGGWLTVSDLKTSNTRHVLHSFFHFRCQILMYFWTKSWKLFVTKWQS